MAKIDYLNYEGLKYYRSKHSEEITALETRLTQAYSGADTALSTSLGEQIEVLRKKIPEDVYITMKVGETEVKANGQSTLELIAGSNVTLTPNVDNKSITITAKDTTYPMASDSVDGLLSKEDYTTLHNLGKSYVPDEVTITANDQNQLIVNNVPATKISGVLNVSQIPTTALERLYVAANKAALLALTSEQVQNGDTVKVTSYADGSETPITKMFLVVDDAKLGTDDAINAFTEYTASTYWDNIKDRPTDLAYKGELADVATSGSYNDLNNKPTIPTSTNQLTNEGAPGGSGDKYTTEGALKNAVEAINTTITSLNYAGSDKNGGVANSAAKLTDMSSIDVAIGSTTQPVYFEGGLPKATTYKLESNVPANAVFGYRPIQVDDTDKLTDNSTKLNLKSGSNISLSYDSGTVTITNTGVRSIAEGTDNGTISVNTNGTTTNVSVRGLGDLAYKSSLTYSDVGALSASTNYAGSSSQAGPANTAVKLNTSRSIALGTGVTSTATSFDGSQDITIPITGIKESYLTWGGKNFVSDYGPIDASLIPELSANRLAFGNADAITVEYSRDSGSTWTNYGASDTDKVNLFSTDYGANFGIGKNDSSNKATTAYRLRITIDTDNYPVYTGLNKFMVYCSTNGSGSCWCTIEASLESTPTEWVTFANKVAIGGWSGYNIINTDDFNTYGNTASSQYGLVRFTFGCDKVNDANYNGLAIFKIAGFGGLGWTEPSMLAKYGHLYKIASDQEAVFPGVVTATLFNGKATSAGTADSATTATTASKLSTNAGSTTQPVYFSNGVPTAISYTIATSVPPDAVFTDTTYSLASASNDGLMSAADWSKLNNLAAGDLRALANTWQQKQEYSVASTVEAGSTSGSGAINVTAGGIWAAGGILGNKVYNAVWNDLADCIPVDDEVELEAGRCYCFDGKHYYKANKYLADGIIGIHSDTYGMHMGAKQGVKQMDVAVAGFVLAYVDKEYPVGTALTCTEEGVLTAMNKQDKIEYPEKIVATYWKDELEEYWGSDTQKVKVNGRKWVKVR